MERPEFMGVRLTTAERMLFELAAELEGADSLSAWARRALAHHARRVVDHTDPRDGWKRERTTTEEGEAVAARTE